MFITILRERARRLEYNGYKMCIRDRDIGAIIAELRMDRNMKQEDLAAILNISRSALANWESGNRRIDIETLVVIADFFGVRCV